MSEMIDQTAARLDTHEAVCAERYTQILGKFDDGKNKMDKLEGKLSDLDKKLLWVGGIICLVALFGPHALEWIGLIRG